MLNLYRRHLRKCPHRAKGQEYIKCSCPIWCDGEVGGKRRRESLKTRDWARAVKRAEKLETGPEGARIVVSVGDAISSYLGDCRARNLAGSTIEGYTKTLEHLADFCASKGMRAMDGIDLGALTDFRAGRNVKPSTSGKELETLRAFCAFSKKRGWMPENFAQELEPPREDGPPTLPFTHDEVNRILAACNEWGDKNPNTRELTRANARALVLVMLFSGLRISDAVQLRRDAVDLATGKMLLRIMKTGRKQYLRLGQPAIDALAALQQKGEYFFWNGSSALKTAIGLAQRTIGRLLARAGVAGGHPHRFRDTFSVRLLEKGEQLRTVQLLLGHSSIKTTEKHYAPWVESFQATLDAATAKLDFGQAEPQDFGTKSGTRRKQTAKLLKIG